jgi:hypothetical protein
VIWSNKILVILLHRRGGYRLWRRADEAIEKSGRVILSLCFGPAFRMIKKGHATARDLRQSKRRSKLKGRLKR